MESLDEKVQADITKTEYEQAILIIRDIFTHQANISTVLLVANVTVIGYAISEQISGIILVGAIFPLMIIVSSWTSSRKLVSPIYTAYSIEKKYGGNYLGRLLTTSISIDLSPHIIIELEKVDSTGETEEKEKLLKKMWPPMYGRRFTLIDLFLLLTAIAEIVVPFILTKRFGWRLL